MTQIGGTITNLMPDGNGNALERNGKAFLATFKKQTNPDKYDADGYD
jgi:hypothetical protein